jgi:hypothetical protein
MQIDKVNLCYAARKNYDFPGCRLKKINREAKAQPLLLTCMLPDKRRFT